MSTQTQRQQYLVHLEVRATAGDPDQAVHEALTLVRSGALGGVTWSVEPVTESPAAASVPAARAGSDREAAGDARDPRHPVRETYDGEFLG